MLAVLALLQFFAQLKSELAGHRPLFKFLAFKLVVFLTFLEGVSKSVFHTSPTSPR